MEDVLYDNVAVHVFARVEAGHALDETTTCKFRHLLEEHDLTRLLFELSRDILNQRGLLVKAGTIVDATIISAPSPTKSQAKQRDPEMNCLHGQEEVIYGDTAHVSDQRRAQVQARGVQWHVLRKATRTRKLPCADQSFNKKSNRTRSRVEHTFGVIKHLWGYCKTRYRGLDKNAARVYTRANFYLARDSLLATMTAG